ncbi:MAG: hypothetical protein ACOZBL_05005 [Patescibacteria group bacterium]
MTKTIIISKIIIYFTKNKNKMLQNIKKLFYEAQALYWLKQYNLAIEKYEAISQHTNN